MNCPRCSAEVTPQDKYCPSCGFTLEQAGKGGHHRKPVKRSYEEASTQVVDVDEFRKYMQAEKAQTGAAAPEASASAPVAAAPKAAPVQSSAPAPKAAAMGDLNPSAMTGTGMHQPVEVPRGGTNPLVYVGVLVVVLLLAAIGYSMMGGGGDPAPAQPAPGQPGAGNPGEAPAQPAPGQSAPAAPAQPAPEKK